MNVTSASQFASLLEQSNLLSPEQLDAARAELSTADESHLPQVVDSFCERGWLTRWQGKMLLSGRHAFFLGRYKLLDHLGEGGMGSVFKAEQTPLGRLVAIKVMQKSLLNSREGVARFRREIRAAASLSHPNIVAAYDADSIGGRHFLVMEFVPGYDLGAIIKREGKLPIGAGCEYVRQAAIGLEHAHQRGMVHRDIKPSNLFLTRGQDGLPVVKILDMGLARLSAMETADQTELTHTGQVVGTPDYISPEQARDTHSADIRSDIYSLGCTLYRLLTGETPFQSRGALAKIMARFTEDVPKLRVVLPHAPAELESVLATMVQRDPEARYQHPRDAAQALAPFSLAIPVAQQSAHHVATTALPSDVDPAFNEFLGQLEAEAISDEDVETGSRELDGTQVNRFPELVVAEGDPTAEIRPFATQPQQGDGVSDDRRRTGHSGSSLRNEITARKQADRRRLLIASSVIVLFVASILGLQAWHLSGQTELIVDWPPGERNEATIVVDGIEREFSQTGHLRFPGSPGRRRLRITRVGFKPIEATLSFDRGETKSFSPDWQPTDATVRLRAFEELKRDVESVLSKWSNQTVPTSIETITSDPGIQRVRNRLIAFSNQVSDHDQQRSLARMMSCIPWPVDLLRRGNIDPLNSSMVQGDAAEPSPEALVAILGDGRMHHWGQVHDVEFSPNGKWIASAGSDSAVRFWDVESGRQINVLRHIPPARVLSVSFDSTGERLASCSSDGKVRIWRLNDSSEQQLNVRNGRARTAAFSHDGSLIATTGDGGWLSIWNVSSMELRDEIQTEAGRLNALAWSPDDSSLIASGAHPTAILYDVQNAIARNAAGHEKMLAGSETTINAVAFSPDGTFAGSAGWDGIVRLWDLQRNRSGGLLQSDGIVNWLHSIAISPDGRTLAVGSGSGTVNHEGRIHFWDLTARKLLKQTSMMTWVSSLDFSPDGRLLVAGSNDGSIRCWNPSTGEEVVTGDRPAASIHTGQINDVSVRRDGSQLATAGHDGTIRLWDLATGSPRATFDQSSYVVWSVAYQPDGNVVAAADGRQNVSLWDIETATELRSFKTGAGVPFCLVYSPDGKTIAAGLEHGAVRLWEATPELARVKQLEPLQTLQVGNGLIGAIEYSSDGEALAAHCATSDGNAVQLVRIGSGGVKTLMEHAGTRARAFCLSVDGQTLIAARESTIILQNIHSNRMQTLYPQTNSWLSSVVRSPDGSQLVCIDTDGVLHLWDFDSQNVEKTFRIGFEGYAIHNVAFTPDGRHLVTANGNGTIYVLRLREWSAEENGER